jgi:lysophospholipase L1-like esterase
MPDRSPKGTNLTATGGSGRPSIGATAFAGQPGINFASMASGWAPLQSSAIGALITGKTALTEILLVCYGTTQTAGYLSAYDTSSPGAGDWRHLHRQPGAGQHQITWYGASNCTNTTPVAGDTITVHEVVSTVFDAAATHKVSRVNVDGALLPGTFSPDVGPASFSNRTLKIGSAYNGASPTKAIIAGVAYVARALTDVEILQWGAWMRQQYGLASTPTRILHAGDSIVVGAADTGGWRRRSWEAYLVDCGTGAQRFGAYCPTGNIAGTYFLPDFCSGVSGSTVASTVARLTSTDLVDGTGWKQPPHVLTFSAGINDIVVSGSSAATLAAAWESALASIYAASPTTKIKLMKLINNTMSGGIYSATVQAANELGPTAVANAIAAHPGMDAEWVDSIYSVSLSADGEHPDSTGYAQMAADYYPRITSWLNP